MKTLKFNKTKLVNYIWDHLTGDNDSMKVWTSPHTEFVHTRTTDYRDDEHQLVIDWYCENSPRSKGELRRSVDFILAQ
jgi:hypothetical protein